MMRRSRALGVVALLVVVAAPVRAQELWPVSLEISGGLSWVLVSDRFRGDNGGFSGSVVAGVHGAEGRRGLTGALELAAQVPGPFTDDCVVRPEGGCVPGPPDVSTLTALLGWEPGQGRYRLAGGVGAAGGTYLALVSRADLYSGARHRSSVFGSARAMVLPSYRGETLVYLSLGVGLRVR